MAVRCADCTRRQHRNREASETRCAQTADASLSDFGTGDVSPSNGDSLQRPLHKQRQRQRQPQRQQQLSLRGAKGNGNARCAEMAYATEPIAMLTGVAQPNLRSWTSLRSLALTKEAQHRSRNVCGR